MRKTLLAIVATLLLITNTALAQPNDLQAQKKVNHVRQTLSTTEGQQIKTAVDKYSRQYNVDKALIHAVILTESNYNPKATSSCGARGLMQLMPATFHARKVGSNYYSIDQNIHAGTKHLKGLLAKYEGDVPRALGAYNLGGAHVQKGKPLPKQAQYYVNKVYYHKNIVMQVL